MHDYRLIGPVLERLEQLARDEKALGIAEVYIRLGPLADIGPDHFVEHFRLAARGTLAEEAAVYVDEVSDPADPVGTGVFIERITLVE